MTPEAAAALYFLTLVASAMSWLFRRRTVGWF